MSEYKIELHAHSAESSRCGSIKAEALVKKYKRAGYSALVLTDHYYARFFDKVKSLNWEEQFEKYLKGYKIAKRAAAEMDFNLFLGIEIRFNDDPNEYLVYGLGEKFLFENQNLHHLNLEKFKELTDSQSNKILIYQAHPYRKGMSPAADYLLDGLEVYNGNRRHNSQNEKAHNYAAEHQLKMISGSDFHEDEDLARGGIVTQQKIEGIRDLLQILELENYRLIKS
ncbi:hypothetical protein C8C76_12914 [Halanaerobium saccharolyticum]|jgi:hypothetical protein|uniref:Polymerase/histidinol phosphatase N-terminal domain-containing protein n=1 Tax=Halanaerobium saccharolyticum TaxID=43595 RepID=A0A2T5RH84_9FIRM|nr:PHP domain-containing protein [Halanaerobium saccharolyticum]PTV95344.1 hypothetical protein C8C76_12914 [Halanaerobium saccharolyticum]